MTGALRWVLAVTGPALAPRLLPLWMGIAFLLTQFWTLIDWEGLRSLVARHPILVGVAVASPCALVARGPLRAALMAPSLRAIWRAPISAWRRGLLASLPAATMMSPALAALALFPAEAGLAAVPIGVLPVVGARGVVLVVLALAVPAAGIPLSALAIWAAGAAMLRWSPADTSARGRRPIRPPGPIAALVWRDVLAVARSGGGHAVGSILPAIPLAGLLVGLRVNGGLSTAARAQAVAVMLCLVAPLAGAVLGELRRVLGHHLDSPRLPVGPGQRWVALALVVVAVMSPTGVALAAVDPVAVVSPTAGGACASLVAGALLVLAWARPGGRRPYSMGLQAMWCLWVAGLVLWDSSAARLLQVGIAIGAGVAGRAGLARGRRRLAEGRC